MVRWLLPVILLIAGCFGTASPAKKARMAVSATIVDTAGQLGITKAQAQCVGAYLDKTLSESEMVALDTALTTGADSAKYSQIVAAGIAACTK
jgi:hypothetical protein